MSHANSVAVVAPSVASVRRPHLDLQYRVAQKWSRKIEQSDEWLTCSPSIMIIAVHEALDARDWNRADQYVAVTAKVLDNYRAQLDRLTALLKR